MTVAPMIPDSMISGPVIPVHVASAQIVFAKVVSELPDAALRSLALAIGVWVILRLFRVRNVLALKCAWTLVLAAAFLMPLLLPIASRLPRATLVLPAFMHRVAPATPAPLRQIRCTRGNPPASQWFPRSRARRFQRSSRRGSTRPLGARVSSCHSPRCSCASLSRHLRPVACPARLRPDSRLPSLAIGSAGLSRANCCPRPPSARERRRLLTRHDWFFCRPARGLHGLGQREVAHRSRPRALPRPPGRFLFAGPCRPLRCHRLVQPPGMVAQTPTIRSG